MFLDFFGQLYELFKSKLAIASKLMVGFFYSFGCALMFFRKCGETASIALFVSGREACGGKK